MHEHFHTILGLMDAHDPLLSCEHHGRNHLPWLLHELTLKRSILSHCLGEVGPLMDLWIAIVRDSSINRDSSNNRDSNQNPNQIEIGVGVQIGIGTEIQNGVGVQIQIGIGVQIQMGLRFQIGAGLLGLGGRAIHPINRVQPGEVV